jgi:subtilisin family serine protease
MAFLTDAIIHRLVFETFGLRRYTQDSPIQPDVWVRFLKLADRKRLLKGRVSLILTPKETPGKDGRPPGGAAMLAECIRTRILNRERGQEWAKPRTATKIELAEPELAPFKLASTARNVVIDVTFEEMLRYLVPITHWWTKVDKKYRAPRGLQKILAAAAAHSLTIEKALVQFNDTEFFRFVALTSIISFIGSEHADESKAKELVEKLAPAARRSDDDDILDERDDDDDDDDDDDARDSPDARPDVPVTLSDLTDLWSHYAALAARTFRRRVRREKPDRPRQNAAAVKSEVLIWSIQRNRTAHREARSAGSATPGLRSQMGLSSQTVKADAATQLFSVNTADLTWAVVDTGIDATHPAFDRLPATKDATKSRVIATLDFTRLRDLLAEEFDVAELVQKIPWDDGESDDAHVARLHTTIDSIRRRNVNGRELDWSLLELLIRRDPEKAPAPMDAHGTHVAGILGGFLPKGVDGDPDPFTGICPSIQMYDLRVFGEEAGGDEFTILAALDYISWVNRDPERPAIHGVNLSLAIRHVVDAHACGRTPICDACNRLVGGGTVVVAAAGNAGFDPRQDKATLGVGYRGTSITDPGNAEYVITVGATHRNDPHTYGVSYFSSRGPTGDGRMKPDLVAPGEKIRSTAPGGKTLIKDGTSMAAPHVSGVCALLMARHREFIGQPKRIKDVLVATATDLGRERSFQGAGLVDALRALQSV